MLQVPDRTIRDIEEALKNASMLQGSPSEPSVLIILPRSQASEFLATPAEPGDQNGFADIGGPPAVGIEDPGPVTLFADLAVRDTINHRPTEGGAVLDLRGARNWHFDIENGCNQEVTVNIIGGANRSPDGMGLLGVSVAIAANTLEPIATDIWLAFMSLQISYAVGPASGAITAKGFRQLFSR